MAKIERDRQQREQEDQIGAIEMQGAFDESINESNQNFPNDDTAGFTSAYKELGKKGNSE